MLHRYWRHLNVLAGHGGKHKVHGASQLHQSLQVVDFSIQFPQHVGEQTVHPTGHAVVGKVEIYQDIAHVDAERAEPLVCQVLVDELQQEAELLLLAARQRLQQTVPSDQLHQHTAEMK